MGDVALRVTNLFISALIFAGLGLLLSRRVDPWLAAALIAPLLASMYVVNAGAWVLADNPGWAWVGLLSLMALTGRPGVRWSLVMGVCLLLAVWTRQNLLWLALPLWAAAWLHKPTETAHPLRDMPTRVRQLAPLALATVPAVASLVYLYLVWGGLVPYEFQGQYKGANPANIALQFVMLAGLGVFFLPAIVGVGEDGWRDRATATLKRSRVWIGLTASVVVLVTAVTPTTHEPTMGRAGLVWNLADMINPIGPIGVSNPVIVVLAGFGGALLAFILACVEPRGRWILASIFVGFGVAQGASSEVWQRYHEPFALFFLAFAVVVAMRTRGQGPVGRAPLEQLAPLFALALVMAILTAGVLWQREINPWRQGEDPTSSDPNLPPPPSKAIEGLSGSANLGQFDQLGLVRALAQVEHAVGPGAPVLWPDVRLVEAQKGP